MAELDRRRVKAIDFQEWFWSNVDRSGDCWIWTRGKTANGYGKVVVSGKQAYAHRLAYEFVNGPIPDGMLVCHHCDNPPCCNPAHLFLGTPADNVADMDAKQRSKRPGPKGEAAPSNKLTTSQVDEIRSRYAAGDVSQSQLARDYGVRQSTIWRIVHGLTWLI